MAASQDTLCGIYNVRQHAVLGRGSDGMVVRGEQRTTGAWHALKWVEPGRGAHASREVAVLSKLDHPNIVKLLQVFPACAGREATVLAFPVADTDLYALLRRRGGLVSP